jgi:lantibiotic biosynthesis protein
VGSSPTASNEAASSSRAVSVSTTLHPFALARVTAQPFELIDALQSIRTIRDSAHLADAERELTRSRVALEAALHLEIGRAAPGTNRRDLLAISRNLRRHQKISEEQQRVLALWCDGATLRVLATWRAAQTALGSAEEAYEQTYEAERQDARAVLRQVGGDRLFQLGLLAASPTLYRSIVDYLATETHVHENRQLRQTESALLRYLTRAAAKTSPFSTFTNLALAREIDLPADELIRLPDAQDVTTVLSLNKVLYAIIGSLVRRTPALYPCFSITLNPTLGPTESGYRMLLAAAGRERIVTLPRSPAIATCISAITEAGGTLTYAECRTTLAEAFGIPASALSSRLDRMIQNGLLQLNAGISDQERDWAPILTRVLESSAAPLAVTLTKTLRRLEALRVQLATADAGARVGLMQGATDELDALIGTLTASEFDVPAGGAAPPSGSDTPLVTDADHRQVLASHLRSLKRNVFYEDAALQGGISFNRQRLAPALVTLREWVEVMQPLSTHWSYQATMREHFARRFGGASRVDFLTFYDAFHQDVFEAIAEHSRDPSEAGFMRSVNPYGLEIVTRAVSSAEHAYRRIQQRWAAEPDSEELTITRADLDPGQPAEFSGGPASGVVFTQLIPGGTAREPDRILVERSLLQTGMGRYYSRFLHLVDPAFTASLHSRNRVHDTLVAELNDDSEFSFNANLHPILTDHEIGYPSGLTGVHRDRNVSLSDIDVEPDPTSDHRLRLTHRPTGWRVWPVDLGLLTHLLRPPMFRVLLLFSPLVNHQIAIPPQNPLLGPPSTGHVVRRPRLIYKQHLVLARQSWLVPPGVLLAEIGHGSPADAFRRLDRWRRAHGLPADVYLSLKPLKNARASESAANAAPDSIRSGRASGHKPQYISFESIRLVELLIEAVRNHQGGVAFDEMLPRRHMLPRSGSRSHMTELFFQLDREQ